MLALLIILYLLFNVDPSYFRFVRPKNTATALITLCVILIALTLTIKEVLNGSHGHQNHDSFPEESEPNQDD